MDALDSSLFKMQEEQVKPASLQEALASAMQFESIVKFNWSNSSDESSSAFKARKDLMDNTDTLKGICWHCRQVDHKKNDCFKS